MPTTHVARMDEGTVAIDSAVLDNLRSGLRGTVLLPGDHGYDKARTVWNAMIDRRPTLVIQCAGVSDIQRAVNFARTNNLLLSVKGAGHNIAGSAVCDGGLLIDLSGMRSVRIDPIARVAHVEPGATLGDFDTEAQVFGLATPLGINSTTGVAGLTLGAGFGWLSRKHGMTIDNLRAVDVITADGKFVHANKSENADLFWAIRGGGGNFGIVSRFEFQLHALGPDVLSGLVVYPLSEAASALKQYRQYAKHLSEDTTVWAVLRKAPPLPFLPPGAHGMPIIAFALFHAGNPDSGQKAIEPVRHFGTPLGEHIGVQPYRMWQQAFDPLLTPGARNYWKSHNFTDLSDGAIDTVINYVEKLPSPQCEIFFGLIGGATMRPAADATAYSSRDTLYVCNVHGRWESPSDDHKCTEWARAYFRDTAKYASGSVYVNFLTDDERERVTAAYGPNYHRLMEIKSKYDPHNLFRMNQNIRPK
ncbi:FAD-linked oxidase [candidate division GN15 bacterium]|uniref:FAD-linked oxidase n=1 Tax=candidate division GN15 bacterium TaxID=2072418 RepID=A0A855X3F4_9BACT|nr:MAG: FAD-linked oxidase [candidate division GN15 bacterium]